MVELECSGWFSLCHDCVDAEWGFASYQIRSKKADFETKIGIGPEDRSDGVFVRVRCMQKKARVEIVSKSVRLKEGVQRKYCIGYVTEIAEVTGPWDSMYFMNMAVLRMRRCICNALWSRPFHGAILVS
jgi:hypothetical protein